MPPMTHIYIGGLRFEIVRENIHEYGLMRFDDRQIVISSNVTDSCVCMTTLRHEMIHAALEIAGISHMRRYDEEPIVRAIKNLFFPAWDAINNQTINLRSP